MNAQLIIADRESAFLVAWKIEFIAEFKKHRQQWCYIAICDIFGMNIELFE